VYVISKLIEIPKLIWTLIKKPDWRIFRSPIKASWSSIASIMDWQNNIPIISDDASHYNTSPFYFEWWYFDVNYSDDSVLSLIFHVTDLIRPSSTKGSMNISILNHGHTAYHRFIPYIKEKISTSRDKCDIWINNNHCWIDESVYYIQVTEQDLNIELKFSPCCVGWRPGNGKIVFGDENAFFAWIVPQAKAIVSGKITLNGKVTPINGIGYHDHNWGTISLFDSLKNWSWGRIYLNDYTCVFADIQFSARFGGERVMPFVLFYEDQILASNILDSFKPQEAETDFLFDPTKSEDPKGWKLGWENAEQQLNLALQTRYSLEKADLLPVPGIRKWLISKFIAHPYYIRCLTTASGVWKCEGQSNALTGEAICEQICMQREK
jgi:hypothetical protein